MITTQAAHPRLEAITADFDRMFVLAPKCDLLTATDLTAEDGSRTQQFELPLNMALGMFERFATYREVSVTISQTHTKTGTPYRQSVERKLGQSNLSGADFDELTVLQAGILYRNDVRLRNKKQHVRSTADGLVECTERYIDNFADRLNYLAELICRSV